MRFFATRSRAEPMKCWGIYPGWDGSGCSLGRLWHVRGGACSAMHDVRRPDRDLVPPVMPGVQISVARLPHVRWHVRTEVPMIKSIAPDAIQCRRERTNERWGRLFPPAYSSSFAWSHRSLVARSGCRLPQRLDARTSRALKERRNQPGMVGGIDEFRTCRDRRLQRPDIRPRRPLGDVVESGSRHGIGFRRCRSKNSSRSFSSNRIVSHANQKL